MAIFIDLWPCLSPLNSAKLSCSSEVTLSSILLLCLLSFLLYQTLYFDGQYTPNIELIQTLSEIFYFLGIFCGSELSGNEPSFNRQGTKNSPFIAFYFPTSFAFGTIFMFTSTAPCNLKNVTHNNQNSFYKWAKISAFEITIFA